MEQVINIKTQPNEKRCMITKSTHILNLPGCCPVSGNPQPGSKIKITYTPKANFLEVYSLSKYIDSYKGGRGDIRSMEGMIQAITKDCAELLGVSVTIEAELIINPNQLYHITTTHHV